MREIFDPWREIFDPLGDQHYYGCGGVLCKHCLFYIEYWTCKQYRNKFGYKKELI